MRPRFLIWTIVFVITRTGDLWSTNQFMKVPGGVDGEMNPLSSILGFTFWPLFVSNLVVSGVLLYGHWWYCRHYSVRSIEGSPPNRWQFLSLVFYGRADHARYLPFRSGSEPKVYQAQLGHVLLQTIAVVSMLAVLHNLGQYHGWAINDSLREVLVRPAFVIYGTGAVLFVIFYARMAGLEFRTWHGSQRGAG